ncbi:MAG: T9SS type A sorting domain-containing protein [Ignavibacteriaceae bacterium]|nr:T9SS type A sorting domain-containing protein [Ignavibacteriaceae bacterium]
MKLFISCFILTLLSTFKPTYAQSVIINEIYNSSGNDEWLELLVLHDGLDIRNWSIRDFSSSGVAQSPLNFTNSELWNNLRKGTIIVIARSENSFAEDIDASDYTLTVKSNNALYLTGTSFLFAGGSEAVQIRNTTQEHVHGISWGAANSASIPNPKIHFSTSATSNTSTFFNEDDISELNTISNWTVNGVPSRGTGNTVINNNWITSLRARIEGSGAVTINPSTINGNEITNISFSYKRDPGSPINSLRIIIPNGFLWSQNISSVSTSNFTSFISISSDTISFTDVLFLNDSISISISIIDITVPSISGNYKFKFLSGVGMDLAEVNPSPILTVYGVSVPISQVKMNDNDGLSLYLGQLVTVRGIVTVASQFGSPSYIQDNTGGISIFGSTFSGSVQIGDEVIVSGTASQFNGLNQLENPVLHQIVSNNNEVEPLLANPFELSSDGEYGIENFEGRLIRVNGVLVTELNGSPISNWAYKNYLLTGSSAADTIQLRIDNNTSLIGIPAPAGRFDVVGVVSQYKTSQPFVGGYQIMPRFSSDIISSGPIIEKFPEEVELTSNSITLNWQTINPGSSRIRYGITTSYELGVIEPDNELRTNHNLKITGLNAATIYNLQAFSVVGSDTSFSGNIISSTTSGTETSGKINIYFNKSVNTTVSGGAPAAANADLKTVTLNRINNATHSIDAALYSLSGSVGAEIANALINAKNRGVKVRVIGENDNKTTTPWTTLQNNGIAYVTDQVGLNDGMGLSHNKFFIIDYRGGAPDKVWVITGSWNATDPGTYDDRQNLVEIQDVALAGAFTREFDEMWGSNGDSSNPSISRFGSRKLNNTPHNFVIGGRKVECYFSPSDRTTYHIGKTLSKAQKSVNIATLTLTRRDLADSIISAKNRNTKARVILSNNVDSGTQFSYLQSNGIDVRLKGFSTGLLHHKYAIIDAEPTGFTPFVITGSHNWSSSAENSNDENTLIIQDAQIANFYLQEFAARYYEASGTDSIIVTDIFEETLPSSEFFLAQNYPNPFNPITIIDFSIPYPSKVELAIYNLLGEKITVLKDAEMNMGNHRVSFDASDMSAGVYFYRLSAGGFSQTKKLTLLK